MLSLDTNLLFTAANPLDEHQFSAQTVLGGWAKREDVVISELVLAEFYGLLRSPKINSKPLSAPQATTLIQAYRHHPCWRLMGFPATDKKCHDAVWKKAAEPGIAYRRFYDVRLALSLIYQGVDEFATINMKDFQGLGFRRVWNPLAGT